MNAWQKMDKAPDKTLVLAWLEGWEFHSDVFWRRCGYALVVLHDGQIAAPFLRRAREAIIGVTDNEWNLKPVRWAALLDPPSEAEQFVDE